MNRTGSWGRLMFVQPRTSGKADATVPAKRLQSASFVSPNLRMDAMGPHVCATTPMDAMGPHVWNTTATGMDAIRPCTQTASQLLPATSLLRVDAIRPPTLCWHIHAWTLYVYTLSRYASTKSGRKFVTTKRFIHDYMDHRSQVQGKTSPTARAAPARPPKR